MRLYWRSTVLPSGIAGDERAQLVEPPDSKRPGGEYRTTAKWAFILNLPCYARGLPIVPAANGSDGVLDICAYQGGSTLAGLKLLAHMMLSRHHLLTDCQMLQATHLRLESDLPVPFQVDGDPGGWLPVDIEIVPRRLRLIVP